MGRYMTADDALASGFDFTTVGNISKTGSVLGMQQRFGWAKRGQVRVGSYVYNVGPHMVRQFEVRGLVRS